MIDDKKIEDLIKKAVNVHDKFYTINHETRAIDQAIEENAELIHALSKFKRGRDSKLDNIIEEMGDVLICIHYLIQIYNIPEEKIKKSMIYKVNRFMKRCKNQNISFKP